MGISGVHTGCFRDRAHRGPGNVGIVASYGRGVNGKGPRYPGEVAEGSALRHPSVGL